MTGTLAPLWENAMMDTDTPVIRRRGGRASVVAAREAEKRPRVSTIKYGIRPVEAVTAEQLERLHQASLAILREIGRSDAEIARLIEGKIVNAPKNREAGQANTGRTQA